MMRLVAPAGVSQVSIAATVIVVDDDGTADVPDTVAADLRALGWTDPPKKPRQR